ncbi:MAG: UDP-glucose dehydrogenase family protein [Actinomycetota bacterium]
MRVGVIGTGHVGLLTCVSLAAFGHDVVGTDSDAEKLARLEAGTSPFFEPGLQELLTEQTRAERLRFSPDASGTVREADVVFICVGTPARATGEANLVAVERAATDVALSATGPLIVVEKSTVPAGTANRVRRTLLRARSDLNGLEVASNPEFLREGRAVEDSLKPERILVGAESEDAFEAMRALYKPLTDQGVPLIETDIATAELAKHACNAFLALKISFANALARMCERADADVTAVADVMGSDPRIGRDFLNAGLGYGGYCFPKDLVAFERLAARLGYDFPLLKEVARINEEAVRAAVDKVRDALWNLEDKRIALFGLAFKAGTDDVRFAPALTLARILLEEGADVVGYDPQAGANAKADLPDLAVAGDPYEAASDAHCVVLCTEWEDFRALDLDRLKSVMAYPVVVDGRNLLKPAEMAASGFTYYPTGRPPVS